MQVLLTTLNAKYIHMNLALRILYGLNKDYKGLQWKEFAIKEKPEEIAAFCQHFDVVCFSCYIWNITQTLEVARILKHLNPRIQIMLGGPEVSYDWQEIILHPEVDMIIPGEGEIPFRNFLKHWPDLVQTEGVAWKNNGKVEFKMPTTDFDVLELANLNPYAFEEAESIKNRVAYIETSRGCPYKCEFCLASLDNNVRYLPIDTIKANLLFLMQHGRVIKFLDRTFNVKKDFTIEIFQFILDHHLPGNVFQFEITADIVHPDIIRFIEEKVPPGLFRFEIGIQTVNQKANLEVGRKQKFDKTASVVKQLQQKVEMHLDLIVGLPFDYMEDIRYSIEQVFALHPPELQLGFLKFLKGTPVREKHANYNYEFDTNPPYQIIRSKFLSAEELQQITLLEEALELFWNKKRAHLPLLYAEQNGGIFPFLLGLGNWFHTHSNFHHHRLDESYNLLLDFCQQYFEEPAIAMELVVIEYYLHHKIKPQVLFLPELPDAVRKMAVKKVGGNTQTHRFIALEVSFDYQLFYTQQKIVKAPQCLLFKYNGREKALLEAQFPLSEVSV